MSILLKTVIQDGTRAVADGKFSVTAKDVAQKLNRIALSADKSTDTMVRRYSKATAEDLKKLKSKALKDSYKRAAWTNPEDGKVYHILEESRKDGKVQVRILDSEGGFIKNAELTPKTIVVFDSFYSPRGITHGEMMETFLKRFNPFANVERLEHKRGLLEIIKYRGRLPMELETKRFKELADKMNKGKQVDYISVSEAHFVNGAPVLRQSGEVQKNFAERNGCISELEPIYKDIMSKGTRIFEAAGNDQKYAKILVSDRLAIDGVEGVGALTGGKVAKDSCSRNSVFTQHYESRNYKPKLVRNERGTVIGVNVTGLRGADFPLTRKTKKLACVPAIGGTSYAVPVRVAKISLNDMMKGIL